MSNYIGVRCPVCNKKFTGADDIVVCPVCGAPHHRDCYKEQGNCVFVEEHLSGMEWKAPEEAPPPTDDAAAGEGPRTEVKRCASCGANNPPDSLYCQICGVRMVPGAGGQQQNGAPKGNKVFQEWAYTGMDMQFDADAFVYGGVSPDSSIGGESVKDLAVYVGQNSAYYLPRFQMFSEKSASIYSMNVSAVFLGYIYFFYRKMYWVGAALLAVSLLTFLPQILYFREMLPEFVAHPDLYPDIAPYIRLMESWNALPVITWEMNQDMLVFYERIHFVTRIVALAVRITVAFFANVIYYKKVVAAVGKIRARIGETMEPARYNTTLAYTGGVSTLAVLAGIGLNACGWFVLTYLFSGIL